MALFNFGGALGAPALGFGGAAVAVVPAAAREKDKGSPATLGLFELQIRCKDVLEGGADLGGLRSIVEEHKAQLRGANPAGGVARRDPATRAALGAWFAKQGPPVKWDDDAPPPCVAGAEIPHWFVMVAIKKLSDDLQLDEVRCLELVLRAQEPDVLRMVEDEQGLGSGSLAHRDDPYAAASELFYVERSALSKVLHGLLLGCHANSTLGPAARDELRAVVDGSLLRGEDGLAAGLPRALVKLTTAIRELGSSADEGSVRRRTWLRRERMRLGETLFLLYQAFPQGSATGTSFGVNELVRCAKALALDDGFFQDPPKGSDEADDTDDRPGVVRALELALLSATAAMPHARNSQGLQALLGLCPSEGCGLGLVPWEGEAPSDPPSPAARLRQLKYLHYSVRQRAAKPEVHGVQGVLLLTFLVLCPNAADDHDSPKNKSLYSFSLEHFALHTLRKLVLCLQALDACNCSDFRSVAYDMAVADMALLAVVGLVEGLLRMIFVSEQLGLLPTLHEFRVHLRDTGKDASEDRDGLEELLQVVADLCLLVKDRDNADGSLDGLWTNLRHLLDFSEGRAADLMWVWNSELEGHAEVFHFLSHHSLLTLAVASANPTLSLLGPLVTSGTTGQSTDLRFYRFWFALRWVAHEPTASGSKWPATLSDIGNELANMPGGHPFPGHRPRLSAALLDAWTAGLLAGAQLLRCPEAIRRIVEADLLGVSPTQRGDLTPELVRHLAWVATSEAQWWSPKDGAEERLPALRGAIFKFLASWVACDKALAPSRADAVFYLLTRDETSLLPPALRAQRGLTAGQGRLFPSSADGGASSGHTSGHLALMATLEEGRPHAATDGLLVLLTEVLPSLLPAGRRGQVGSAQGARVEFGKVRALLCWVKEVLEKCGGGGGGGQFGEGRKGERFKVASRCLALLLAVLEADKGAAAVSPTDESGPSWVLSEMLCRSTLLGRVLDLVTDPHDHPMADAAFALDEYCALESRRAVRRLLVVTPKPPERRAIVGPDFSSKPGLVEGVDTWPWWRQRATALALALLASVGRREDGFIDASMDAARKQPRTGGARDPRANPPNKLAEWLMGSDPRPVRALAYLVAYARMPTIPVLAAALLAHVTRSRPSGSLLAALFVTSGQAGALIAHLAAALWHDHPEEPTSAWWRPPAELDQADPVLEPHALLAIARSLTSVRPSAHIGQGSGHRHVQLAVLEMLLSPLREDRPAFTAAFLGLGPGQGNSDAMLRVCVLRCLRYHSPEGACAEDAPLAEKCFELVFRASEAARQSGALDEVLEAVLRCLEARADPDFFVLPNRATVDTSVPDLAAADQRVLAWHFKIAALFLSSAAANRRGAPVRRCVTALLDGGGDSLLGASVQSWGLFGDGSAGALAGGWERLLRVCVVDGLRLCPDLADTVLGAKPLKDLVSLAVNTLVDPQADMAVAEPLARSLVLLVDCLRSRHPLIVVTPSGVPERTVDGGEAAALVRALLDVLARPAGLHSSSHEFRGNMALALVLLLRHTCLEGPQGTDEVELQRAMRQTRPSLVAARHRAGVCSAAAEGHEWVSSLTSIRSEVLGAYKPCAEVLPRLLAKDGLCSDVPVKWRVAALTALATSLELLRCAGDDGAFLLARLLQVLYCEHALEQLIATAAGDSAAMVPFAMSAASGSASNGDGVRAGALAVLLEVALHDMGASSLRTLSAVARLTSCSDPSVLTPLRLGGPCRVVGALLGSLPGHGGLAEEAMRFLEASKATAAMILEPRAALGSRKGLQDACALASLLASALASLDQRLQSPEALEALFPGLVAPLLAKCWPLLKALASFPSSAAATIDAGSAWSEVQPAGADEAALAERQVRSPPPCCLPASWMALDNLKAPDWWALALALATLLRRAAKLKGHWSLGAHPAAADGPALAAAIGCAVAVSEDLLRDGAGEYVWLLAASLEAVECLMGLAAERATHPDLAAAEKRLLAKALGLASPGVSVVDRAAELLGGGGDGVYGAVSESDFFLKKVASTLRQRLEAP